MLMDQQDRCPSARWQSRLRLATAGILAASLAATPGLSQVAASATTPAGTITNSVRIEQPANTRLSFLTKNYRPRVVPPVNLANTSRLESLIKAGNLYLTAQDVVALVLENNIDIEVQRYAPLLAREILRRAQGGGLLRNVGQGVAAGPTSVSPAGVSINTNGAPVVSGTGVNSSVLTQLGPTIPSLDPSLSVFAQFQHQTIPQSNTLLSGTQSLVIGTRTFQASYSQATDFGLTGTMSFSSQYQ